MKNKPGPKNTKYTFGFMDESGLLHTPKEDRIFGLGLLKMEHPVNLHKEILKFKNKSNFANEFKFKDIRNENLNIYKGLLDIYLSTHFTHFSCIVFDKTQLNIEKYFKNDYFKAYNSFAGKLISESLDTGEYLTVLADDVSTPKSDNFEHEIRNKVKQKTRRMALFGICRLESHAVSEIQITDVILGIVCYAFKLKYKLIKPNSKNAKLKILKYLQKLLNVDLLSEECKLKLRFGRKFEIKVFSKKTDSALGAIAN